MTHRREHLLKRLLWNLSCGLKDAAACYRVKVVVNGHDAGSQDVLARSELPGLEVLRLMKEVSPSAARAEGLKQIATCDWIWFLDDDVAIPEETLRRLETRLIHDSSGVDVWGGPNLTPPTSSWRQAIVGALLENPFAVGPVSRRYRPADGGPRTERDDRALMLCHLLVRADLFDSTLFLPGLVCGEENYFLAVLQGAGVRLAFDPQIPVLHERRHGFRSFLRQIQRYGFGRGQLVRELGPFKMGWFTWGALGVGASVALSIVFGLQVIFGIYLLGLAVCLGRLVLYSALGWRALLIAFALVPALQVRYFAGLIQGWARGLDDA